MVSSVTNSTICTHCGDLCTTKTIREGDHFFCCDGCKMVYEIIHESGLCNYYDLNKTPGIAQKNTVRSDKFSFLDESRIAEKLISFKDEYQTHIVFYLPQMHCSSCLYLLENLHRLHKGIVKSNVNFTRKEVDIVFENNTTSLRKVAEQLTAVGYEPYISLNDLKETRPGTDKSLLLKLGIAGFCFSNIMLMSFPEYLGINAAEAGIRNVFRIANAVLSLPVFLYAASPFFKSAWTGLQHRFLNIDIPIALAIIITFVRSFWDLFSGTGAGYFDSLSGIVFFMLAGRILQDKTYRQLSFDRDYTSYFPIAVSIVKKDKEIPTLLPEIKINDTLLVHHNELIPADGLLTKGKALIDYSFVTGETMPVVKEIGEMLYAGGRQTGGNIEILTLKEVSQSYLTNLWNKEKDSTNEKDNSFVHHVSKYFTIFVFVIAGFTAMYWSMHNTAKIWPAITAVFIIACPCALLLSNSFTNGHILTILAHNKFYLRKGEVLEQIAAIDHIVFDKTGTLTSAAEQEVKYEGEILNEIEKGQLAALASCSSHPLSKAIVAYLDVTDKPEVTSFKEYAGKGIEGYIDDRWIKIGAAGDNEELKNDTSVMLSYDENIKGTFYFSNHYRTHIPALLSQLKKEYRLSVLSGDNDSQKTELEKLMGTNATILFHQQPTDKLNYIKKLQDQGEQVMMIGDGLNDAGALLQSNVGIAVSEQANNFTPACDGIIAAGQLYLIKKFMKLCGANKKIVMASFIFSIIYNLAGLFFAVQGNLLPVIAAILMPASSISIVLLSFIASRFAARSMGLNILPV
ncbi:MAG: heavy metal translocating P-type ATPase metal-binding domain-containing protein [Niastella sp.]|nr:heavy metal translocating P-type ATPase metal-binding domain-containing protein [Niastella sp.]